MVYVCEACNPCAAVFNETYRHLTLRQVIALHLLSKAPTWTTRGAIKGNSVDAAVAGTVRVALGG